jgi:hypothetical protein
VSNPGPTPASTPPVTAAAGAGGILKSKNGNISSYPHLAAESGLFTSLSEEAEAWPAPAFAGSGRQLPDGPDS